jgi:probable F420-dependent oxidoreductase
MASVAEAAGASSMWVSDHIVMTADNDSHYPYAADGRVTWKPDTEFVESLTACSFLAAASRRAFVGPAVLVLPQRDPLLLAKTAASIDWLSGGRLVLGVGAGWYAEEFDALGWDFATRGRRMNEALEVLRACWTGRPVEFEGEFFRIPAGVLCFPQPARPGGIPLLVGGMTEVALKRAARLGDGWLALTRWDQPDPATLSQQLERVHALRPAGLPRFRTVLRVAGPIDTDQLSTSRQALAALATLGFDEIAVEPPWHDLDLARRTIAELAAAVA